MQTFSIVKRPRCETSEAQKARDRIRQARYRAENRYGISTEASKKSQRKKRIMALMLLGGKCESCNINDLRVLHFDHINNDGHIDRKVYGRNQSKMVLADPSRFQILCANCHEIKHG